MVGIEDLINVAELNPVAVGVKEGIPINERRAEMWSDLYSLPVAQFSKPDPCMTEMTGNKQRRPLVRR